MKKLLIKAITLTCLGSTLFASSSFAGQVKFTKSSSVNSSYNRAGAVNFIKNYASKPGYTKSPYTTYGSLSNGGDCTNFASQIMHIGGGLPFHGSKGYNRNTVDWYYYGPNIPPASKPRTSSWTGAHEFRQHWGEVNGSGGRKAYQMVVYTNKEALASYGEIYATLWNGDSVQYVNSAGRTYHTQIVWNYGNNTMNVAQHSVNSNYWGLDMGLYTELKNRENENGWVVLLKIKYAK